MLYKIIKTADDSDKDLVFEIGSNSDLVLENTITGNLEWTIENFSKNKKGFLTQKNEFNSRDGRERNAKSDFRGHYRRQMPKNAIIDKS
jgi:hypothetical protein